MHATRQFVCFLFTLCAPPLALAQFEFEREPINYSKAKTSNAVSTLQAKIDAGEAKLTFNNEQGYLPSLLKLLQIEESSQILVQSKTSLQLRLISPQRPRALYFNDVAHVGFVQRGENLEIMATDPVLGEVFYTLPQKEVAKPKFVRDSGQCLSCHATSKTQNVPGGLIRSVFLDRSGQPHYGSSTFTVDHTTDFKNRWGGYFVTGTHGELRHAGNVVSADRNNPTEIDREKGANVTDLSDWLDPSPYPTSHSDIVALMVLEHQTQMQNRITRAAYETRSALHHDATMNRILERPADYLSDTTRRRIASVGDELVKYLLFVDEFPLTSPVKGTSKFAAEFESQGPRDKQGRSLRDFDLKKRMFKYPCSYLIYSPAFDRLPTPVLNHVVVRLHHVLTGKDTSEDFAHLTAADRQAILEILSQTKRKLWKDVELESRLKAD